VRITLIVCDRVNRRNKIKDNQQTYGAIIGMVKLLPTHRRGKEASRI